MSRKVWIPLFVLTLILTQSLSVFAADPDPTQCLDEYGKCYVSNTIHAGTNPDIENGTTTSPWIITDTDDENATQPYRDAVSEAVYGGDYDRGALAVIVCDSSGCTTTWYEYYIDDDGEEATRTWTEPTAPPEVGVNVPFSYLLGGGAFLGVLLIGAGVLLQVRARRRRS